MEDDTITTGDWALDGAQVFGIQTLNYNTIDKMREDKSLNKYDDGYSLARVRNQYNFKHSVYSLNLLKEMVEYMESAGVNKVKIETGEDLPLIATGVEYRDYYGNNTTQVVIGPQIAEEMKQEIEDADQQLNTYHVESIDEDLEDDYPTREKAVEAAEEHKYLTGSQTRIIKPNGKLLEKA